MLRPGDRISAYRIDRVIGSGGMGWVFEAIHLLDGYRVALKLLRDDQLTIARSVERMMREASILASVRHAGMPRLFECGVLGDGRPWIAMELVEGRSLGEQMQRGTMTGDDVIDLVGSVAGVLVAAHACGITHRDLKPDNVFLTPGDASYPVRLLDWGIAYSLAGTRYTDLNEAIGTPTYMAPEQARGGTPEGHCDVYGLGVVAYHALAGKPPFTGTSAVEILVQHMNKPLPPLAPRCPQAPIALVELVERMLSKRIDTRPSAAEVCVAAARLRTRTGTAHVPFYVDGVPAPISDGLLPTTPLRARHGRG